MNVDDESDSLIICGNCNKKAVRWPRRNGTSGQTLVSGVGCWGLAMDRDRSLYIVDYNQHAVRLYRTGQTEGSPKAEGNSCGNRSNQLCFPRYAFVDQADSVYVSDGASGRILRWIKGSTQPGVVVGQPILGNASNQFNGGGDISFDREGNLYVVDFGNHRVQRFSIDQGV